MGATPEPCPMCRSVNLQRVYHPIAFRCFDSTWHAENNGRGRYIPPTRPGYSITIKPESRLQHSFPGGPIWSEARSPKVEA